MKIGIYSPYFDATGGGERYMLTLAESLASTHRVHVIWDDPGILDRAREKFGIDLSGTKVVHNFIRGNNVLGKMWHTLQYDLLIFLSDGSMPFSLARHTLVHFQVPIHRVNISAIKMSRIDAILCNSNFTQSHLDPRLTSKSVVVYPPVDTGPLAKHSAKTNTILSVGRFHNLKKQSVLIEAFAELSDSGLPAGWELVLAGSVLPADRPYLESLKKQARDLPVRFEVDKSAEEIRTLYRTSRIYWHAAGYGERDPVNFEHFGISAVEAMAGGAVPVAFAGGGLPEIITDGTDGFLWNDTGTLREKTAHLVRDRILADKLSAAARKRSSGFDINHFNTAVRELVERISG